MAGLTDNRDQETGTRKICRCECPDGPCEHQWDGPWVEINLGGGGGDSVTCSRCGITAIGHDLRCLP